MAKLKQTQEFGDREWGDWFEHIFSDTFLSDTPADMIQKNTKQNLLRLWCQNFAENLPIIRKGKTLRDLVPKEAYEDPYCILGPAIVVGKGPDVYQKKHMELLAEYKISGRYKGKVFATDGVLIDCLKRDLVPDYVVTVDGHRELIVKYYDDPVVDEHGKDVKAILCATVAPNVQERAKKAGMEVYWFNPSFDDYRRIESFTKMQMLMAATEDKPNGLPSLSCGGNAGTSAWALAYDLFRRSPIGLIGMDMGYPGEFPLDMTAYYQPMMQSAEGNATAVAQTMTSMWNPYFECEVKFDQVFAQYRSGFFEMLAKVRPNVMTVNCTEGGCLFSVTKWPNFDYMKFKDFLDKYGIL